MLALFVTICHWFLELLTPPDIRQIRYITRECVSKIMPPTHDEDVFPISGQNVVP